MDVPTPDPLFTYCSELVPSHDRDARPSSVEYAERTVRALTVLARRYGPVDRDRKKANPVWVDVDGVERTAALREALIAWARDETPPVLRGHRLLRLEYAAVMDGVDVRALNDWRSQIRARYPQSYGFKDLERDPALAETFQRHMRESDEWRRGNVAEQRLRSVLYALYTAHDAGAPVILYVDHLHRLLGGGGEDYPLDLTPELKPLLHRGQIHLWGACSLAEYRATIEHEGSMQRCFQEIALPSVRANEQTLTGLSPSQSSL
jgi:ATP-dependent Clp protease ATP-binding subunit ClpA